MERDDIIEYAHHDHHSEEEGKKVRKKIHFVFWVLLIVTAIEVAMGALWQEIGLNWTMVKWSFVIMTLVKAFYIVMTFMHLGDERQNFRRFILVPYGIFIIFLIFIALYEGGAVNEAKDERKERTNESKASVERAHDFPTDSYRAFHRG